MTQAELGDPLSKAFVSAVELGRAVPSLPALAQIADRLGVSVGRLLPDNRAFPVEYTHGHAYDQAPPHRC